MNQQGEVLRGRLIIYGSINYNPQKDFYDFQDEEKNFDTFFNSVKDLFVSGKDYKIQGHFELKNYQQTELVELEHTRVWLTNVVVGRYFNEFIRGEIKKDILKRVTINGSTGSRWLFKRFNKLQVIVTGKSTLKIYYLVNFSFS